MSSDDFITRHIIKGARGFVLWGLGERGDRRTPIDRWDEAIGAPTIVDEIERRAQGYANQLGGNQAFQVTAIGEDDRELACDVFRVMAHSIAGPAGLMTEPSNEGGQLAQQMRHNEALQRALMTMVDRSDRNAARTVDQVLARNDILERRGLETMELVHRLSRAENEQAIELLKAKASAESKMVIAKKLGDLVPVLVDSVTAKYGNPAAADVTLTNTVREVFSGLSPEQTEQMLGMLNDSQRLQVLHMMKRLAQQHEQKQKALPPDAPPTTPPEKVN